MLTTKRERPVTPVNIEHVTTPRAKRCTRCGETKLLTEFRRRAEKSDGRQSWCAACASAHQRTKRAPAALGRRDRRKQLAVAVFDPSLRNGKNRIAERLSKTVRVNRKAPGITGVCANCGETVQIVWAGEDDEGPCWLLIEPWGVIAYVEGPPQLGGGVPRVSWPLHRGCWMPAAGAAGAGVTSELILAVLRAHESATASDLAAGLGITRKMALSALLRLERHGAVVTLVKRDYVYGLGTLNHNPSNATDAGILRMAEEKQLPITVTNIVARLGITRSAAQSALRRLAKASALKVTCKGESLYAATQRQEQAAAAAYIGPGHQDQLDEEEVA